MAQAKLTMEELRMKTVKAVKDATTFEKSPTLDMKVGTQIVFRVKKVVSGKFKDQQGKPMDLVIASDVRSFDEEAKKFISTALMGYMQDGLQGARTAVTVKAGADARLPNFVVKRFAERGIELHPNYTYWVQFLEEKKVPNGTFKLTAVEALGTIFPDD